MEKVKLTQEQENAINELREEFSDTQIIYAHMTIEESMHKFLATINTDELIRALYTGYEVEPEFDPGDILINTKTGRIFEIYKNEATLLNDMTNSKCTIKDYRHATSEEIEQEKERRWWTKHNRENRELKERDIVNINGFVFYVVEINDKTLRLKRDGEKTDKTSHRNIDRLFESRNLVVICFAEDRKDV